jgi:hypothetical protein
VARPESLELSTIDDALAAGSYIPEILARLVRRSKHHMTAQDIEDLLEIKEAWDRTKDYIGRVREVIGTEYQERRM